MVTFVDSLNVRVANSFVGRWFQLEGSGHPKQRIGSRFTVSYHQSPFLRYYLINLLRPKFVLG